MSGNTLRTTFGSLSQPRYGTLVKGILKGSLLDLDGTYMICKFDDGNGWCTDRFKGFGCIKERCEDFIPAEDERDECTGMEGKGTYCNKYNRFFCAGKENCADSKTYVKKLKMSSE